MLPTNVKDCDILVCRRVCHRFRLAGQDRQELSRGSPPPPPHLPFLRYYYYLFNHVNLHIKTGRGVGTGTP